MADQVFIYDSQTDWEAGEFSGAVANDPAGKLSLATDINKVATLVDAGSLSVYCRACEGTGTTLANLGSAADGTLNSGSWSARTDGRHYLSGAQVQIPYHSSMAVQNDDSKAYSLSAGLRVRLDTIAAGVFMTRSGRFKLGVTSGGMPYGEFNVGGTWHRATGTDALKVDTWYTLMMVVNQSSVLLYVDGVVVARNGSFEATDDPYSGDLVVSCAGDMTDFAYSGDGSSLNELISQSTSGYWSKKIDLGANNWALRYLETTSVKDEVEHSISISMSFADSEDELAYAKAWSWVAKGGTEIFVPPDEGLIYGHWVSIRIHMSCMSWDRDLPLFDRLVMTLREPAVPLTDGDDDEYVGLGEISFDEEQTPEDLRSALDALKKVNGEIRAIKRRFTSHSRAIRRNTRAISDVADDVAEANRVAGFWVGADPELINSPVFMYRRLESLYWALDSRETALEGRATSLESSVSSLQATDTTLLNVINAHTSASTGVHGVGTGNSVASDADVAVVHNEFTAHENNPTGVHGVGVYYVCSDHLAQSKVDTHNGAASAHSARNWATEAEVDAHEAKTTGVHGVGGYSVANSHEVDVAQSDAQDYADGAVQDHNNAVVAHSARNWATEAYADDAVSSHNGSASAHSARGWQTSTDVWNIADQSSQAEVTGHQNRCSNYAL